MCLTSEPGSIKFANMKNAKKFLELIKNFGFKTEITLDPIVICREYLLDFPNEIVTLASEFSGYGYFSKTVDSNVTIEKEFIRVIVPDNRPKSCKIVPNRSLWENYKIDSEIEIYPDPSGIDRKTKKMLLVISRIKDSGNSETREVTLKYEQKNYIPISIYSKIDKLSQSLKFTESDVKNPENVKLMKYYNISAKEKLRSKCDWCNSYTTPETLKDHILNKCKKVDKDLFIECEKCKHLIASGPTLHLYFCGINWYY